MKDGEHISQNSRYRDYDAAREEKVSKANIKKVDEKNLLYVLGRIEDLVEQLNGKTVVSSDHGELLDEDIRLMNKLIHPRWSIKNRHAFDYGHYAHLRHPSLTEISWLEVDSKNRRVIESANQSSEADLDIGDLTK